MQKSSETLHDPEKKYEISGFAGMAQSKNPVFILHYSQLVLSLHAIILKKLLWYG
jgi:hypothetical protein